MTRFRKNAQGWRRGCDEKLDTKPGPKIGLILNYLLAEVIDDPPKIQKNIWKKNS